ncbi:MAG: hypothetical protein ABSA86_02175 [Oryzomonas sp.]|jgi:hypothetical protein
MASGNLIKALLLASLVCALTPTAALTDCGPVPNDGWGANYPAYALWCIQCGGRPYNNNGVGCDMSAAAGTGTTSLPYQPTPTTTKDAVLLGVANGIQQGLRNAAEQQRQQQLRQQGENDRSMQKMLKDNAAMENNARDNASILTEQNNTAEARERQEQARRISEILTQMRGGDTSAPSGAAASFSGGQLSGIDLATTAGSDRCLREDDFTTYQQRETNRRRVLGNWPVMSAKTRR